SQRQRNIERAGAAVHLSRERALRHRSQPEGADAEAPPTGACRRNILAYIPESGIIRRVYRDIGIVTPAVAPAGLGAGPVFDGSFTEGHLAGWIARVSGRVKHTGKH